MYTVKEQMEIRHTFSFIIKQIRDVLNEKRIAKICTNNLPRSPDTVFTTEEASCIIEQVIEDSIYYS